MAMGLLVFVALVLVTMDSYGGVARLSAFLFAGDEMNENISYEVAYRGGLKSIDPELVKDFPGAAPASPSKKPPSPAEIEAAAEASGKTAAS